MKSKHSDYNTVKDLILYSKIITKHFVKKFVHLKY